jgi:CubicO group peptidase (beta-lactamase class C family)
MRSSISEAPMIAPGQVGTFPGGAAAGYGFGLGSRMLLNVAESGSADSVGAFGWEGLAHTYFWVDPAEDFIGILMTQYMTVDPYPVEDAFRNLAYQAIVD